MSVLLARLRSDQFALGLICVLLATLGLSFKAIWIKKIYLLAPGIDAVSILALRMLVAFVLFALLMPYAQAIPDSKGSYRVSKTGFVALALLGFYLSAILDFSSLAYISAGLERIILFLYPTFVVLISIALKIATVSSRVKWAVFISYLGIGAVFYDQVALISEQWITGSLLVFGAAITFAFYTVFSVDYIKHYGSIRFTSIAMMLTAVVTFAHAIMVHGLAFVYQPTQVYLYIVPMAVFATVLPLILMAEGIKRIGAARAATVTSIGPLFTFVFAFLLLDETFGPWHLIGAALVMFGVFLVAKPDAKAKQAG